MHERLKHSGFHRVLFPDSKDSDNAQELVLHVEQRYEVDKSARIDDLHWVVFDFETTGLSAKANEIIEVGAKRYHAGECVDSFHSLVKPTKGLPPRIAKITGIDESMLVDAPPVDKVLPNFLRFLREGVLVAHNMMFDKAFLLEGCKKISYTLAYPTYCTLKMARKLLRELPRHNLDTIAAHYGVEFTERHRSIGDVEVTSKVLFKMLADNGIDTIAKLNEFSVQ